MIQPGPEQLSIVSPEYKRALSEIYGTANALLELFPTETVGDCLLRAEVFESQDDPYGNFWRISKPLAKDEESIAEWQAMAPEIRLIHFQGEYEQYWTEYIERRGALYLESGSHQAGGLTGDYFDTDEPARIELEGLEDLKLRLERAARTGISRPESAAAEPRNTGSPRSIGSVITSRLGIRSK